MATGNVQVNVVATTNTSALSAFAAQLQSIGTTQLTQLEQQTAIESQIQVISATKLELVTAIAAADKERVAQLRLELQVRQAVLGELRNAVTTQGELNALTQQEEALLTSVNTQTGIAGIQLSKARGEATVLARELATGSLNARTLGAFLGAMGQTITVAAIAGFAFIEVINAIDKAILEAVKKAGDFEKEFAKGQESLLHMVETARDLTDAIRIGDRMDAELKKAQTYLDTFRVQELAAWKVGIDKILSVMGGFAGAGSTVGPFEAQRQKDAAAALEVVKQKAIDLNAEIDQTNLNIIKYDELVKRVWAGDGVNALKEQQTEVDKLTAKVAEANKLRQADPGNTKLIEDYDKVNGRLEDAKTKMQNLQKEQDKVTKSVEETEKAYEKVNDQILKAIQHDAQIFQNAEELRKIALERAGIVADSGNTEKQNADKVALTYEQTLKSALALKLANGDPVYTKQQAAALATQVSDEVRVGLAKQLNKERGDILQKYEAENRINRATGNDEVEIAEKVKALRESIQRTMEAKAFSPDQIVAEQDKAEAALRQHLETIKGTGTAQSTLNVQMKEYETILQDIRQQQQVTGAQAFIGPDQKNLQLLKQYRAEIVNVINAMQQQARIKGGLTDPAEIAKADQELQKFSAQYQMLAAKIITTQHQFQEGLQKWADSFGSTGTQLANTLQQTVGVALQSFNTWITTGKFNMQQLLQSVLQLGLQFVEQLIIQRVVALINARLAETQAVASSKIIAAAWASAATAATIATQGEAAFNAPWQVAVGLAGVQAALGIGSLHEGGRVEDRRMHSGGLAHDEVPIIAQEGEIMIQRSVAQQPGMSEFLLGLNSGIFHDGGFIAGGRYHRGTEGFDVGSNIFTSGFNQRDGPDFSGFSDYDPSARMTLERLAGFGFLGGIGTPGFLQGPTMIPTTFDTGGYPYAIQAALPPSDTGTSQQLHAGFQFKPKHTGGMISRMHSGGSTSRGSSSGSSGRGGRGGVHIYAFTDLKQLTKHMSSTEGQKIIFDTVKGRRIDLGIK